MTVFVLYPSLSFSASVCLSLSRSFFSLSFLLSVSLDGLFDLLEAIVPSENPVEAITTAGPAYPVPSDVLIKQSSDFLKPSSFFCSEPRSEGLRKNTLCFIQHQQCDLQAVSAYFKYFAHYTISRLTS